MRCSVIGGMALSVIGLGLVSERSDAAPLTAFTYQGRLKEASAPANGSYDLQFSLYREESGGSRIAGPVCSENVIVQDGLFTTLVDFGPGVFGGAELWLEIEVRADVTLGNCATGVYSPLAPRQALTSALNAQYALTAADSALLNGNYGTFYQDASNINAGTLADTRLSSNVAMLDREQSFTDTQHFYQAPEFLAAGAPFHVDNSNLVPNLNADLLDGLNSSAFLQSVPTPLTLTGSSATHVIRGDNTSGGASVVGVRGEATSAIAAGSVGVFGQSAGPAGTGVYGASTYTAGATSYGVQGHASGTAGRGVYGNATAATGSTTGVYGQSGSTLGRGVVGYATSGTGATVGGLFQSDSTSGRGVFGLANASSGTARGVWGQSNSPDGYAGYFNGGKNYFEGNVGIGVLDPIAKLDVTGASGNVLNVVHTGNSGRVAQFYVGASDAAGGLYSVTYGGGYAGSFEAHDTNSTATLNCYKNGGPALLCRSTLTAGGTAATDCVVSVVGGSDSEPVGGGFLVLGGVAGANISIDSNEIMARSNGATATLALNADGGNVNLIQGGTGNVGIGTSNPQSKLHVNGTARCDVLEITGADLAEKFPASEASKPGLVMEIDPEHPGKLRVARGEYNRRVAGVVSGANGLSAGTIMGHLPGSEDAPAVALSGRVWVHSDASGDAIEVGDLLTTSSTPGHAMKAVDYSRAQGAAIGKAMTALNRGEVGFVLVLVNLQ